MDSDIRAQRKGKAYFFANMKKGTGVEDVTRWIESDVLLLEKV